MKFLFAASKENSKAKSGFDGWRHGSAAIRWRILIRLEGQTELGIAPEVFSCSGFTLGVGLSHGVEMTHGVECGGLALGVGLPHGVELTHGVECSGLALGVGLSHGVEKG